MKIGQMMDSKFLKKEDVEPPKLVTIRGFSQQNAGRDDAPEMKWTMSFIELSKPMVMNSTNLQLAAQALGSDDTDHWIGKQVVLYNDPSVQFQGKLIGGIRIRAPKKRPATSGTATTAAAPAAVTAEEDFDDDIPF
jgi:hypothetical protein